MNKLIKYLLLFTFLFAYTISKGQEVHLPKKVFTFRNARLSFSLGAEYTKIGDDSKKGAKKSSSTSSNGYYYGGSSGSQSAATPIDSSHYGTSFSYLGNPGEINKFIKTGDYTSYSIGFDLYSPNSLFGLGIEANYVRWRLSMGDTSKVSFLKENFEVNSCEFPFYIKLKPGRIDRNHALWLTLGGSYQIPINVQRTAKNDTSILTNDNNILQVNSGIKTIQAMLGLEFYLPEKTSKRNGYKSNFDRTRILLYMRYTYLLDSRLNADYYQSGEVKSIFSRYPNFSYKDQLITFGVKLFFRIGKVL